MAEGATTIDHGERRQSLAGFLLRVAQLARPERGLFRLLFLLTVLGELAALPLPFLLAWLIGRLQTLTPRDIALFAGAVLALQAMQGLLGVLRVRLNRRFALTAANRLREHFFAHLLRIPYRHFLEQQSGGQANSYLNDIDDVDRSVTGLVDNGLRSLLTVLLFGGALLIWNPIIGAIVLTVFPVTLYAQRRIRDRVADSSRRKVDLREELVGVVDEAVGSAGVVKAFQLENGITRQVQALSGHYRDANVVLESYQSGLRSSAAVLLVATQFGFFIVAAWMVLIGDLPMDAFIGQIFLIGRLTAPMTTLFEYINQLGASQAALHRVDATFALQREGQERTSGASTVPGLEAGIGIEVEGLRFRYRDELPLIEDWNFSVPAGSTVAIVGPSGSGKTTFFQVLLGLFEDYQGSVRINGCELRQLRIEALRRCTGVVFQEHLLFNATVRENLLFVLDDEERDRCDDRRLWEVLELAHARDFVASTRDGLDSLIGVNGIRLSGGQRQRLALAQAILRNPPLLLLDEATSALDSISEQHITQALHELLSQRTSLVIAHRLSTVTNADRILVVDGGRIVEQGDHDELMAHGGIYRRLYDSQVEGFLNWEADDD